MKYLLKGLCYGIFASIIFYSCCLLDVHAAVYNPTFNISYQNATSGNKILSDGTQTLYDIDYQGYPEELSDPADKWLTSLVLCVSNSQTNPTIASSNTGSITELSINNSNLKCFLDNNTQGNITIINWKTAGGGSYNHVKFITNQTSDTYIAIIDFSIDLEYYKTPQDYTNISSIIDQQNILQSSYTNTQNTINNQNENAQSIIDTIHESMSNCKINNYLLTQTYSITVTDDYYKQYTTTDMNNVKKGQYYFGFTVSNIAYTKPQIASIIIAYNDNTYGEYQIDTPDNTSYELPFQITKEGIRYIAIRFLRNKDFTTTGTRSGTFSNVYIGQVSHPTNIVQNSKVCTSKVVDIISNNTDNTQIIINNNDNNTQDIIDNQSQNTQDIIDNQSQLNQDMIDSQLVCKEYDNQSIKTQNSALNSLGVITTNNNYGVTDYIKVNENTKIYINIGSGYTQNMCFYTNTKSFINCINYGNVTNGQQITIPNNAMYFRAAIQKNFNQPTFNICVNGNQATNDSLNDLNNNINNDNVDGANNQVDDLFDNDAFNDNSGIQSIINAPLNFINSLNNSCNPINITIPYINTNVSIPCIKQELNNHVPTLVPILSTAINGFVIYRILIDIVYLVKSSRNPDDDRIEVLDL